MRKLIGMFVLTFICISAYAKDGYYLSLNNSTLEFVNLQVMFNNCMKNLDKIPLLMNPKQKISFYAEEDASGVCFFKMSEFGLRFIKTSGQQAEVIHYKNTAYPFDEGFRSTNVAIAKIEYENANDKKHVTVDIS